MAGTFYVPGGGTGLARALASCGRTAKGGVDMEGMGLIAWIVFGLIAGADRQDR